MFKLFSGLIDSNEKVISRLQPVIHAINDLEAVYQQLTEEGLQAKTAEFKNRLTEATAAIKQQIEESQRGLAEAKQQLDAAADGFARDAANERIKQLTEEVSRGAEELRKKQDEALAKLVPEAFAAVREAARRTIKQRHFDVQLLGGIVLHQGKIAEMKTGEGKTLTATLPMYLNALTGNGCHLVTVNDYLARRDPNWMGPVYHALDVSVACIYSQTPDNQMPSFLYDPTYESADKRWHLRPVTRKEAYAADIVYGTNNEFGFDYLRDNMVSDLTQCVQRPLCYAIVDEVDNLLIDEARTPLIISGQAEESGKVYEVFARLMPRLRAGEDYTIEEKHRAVSLTDDGTQRLEQMLRQSGIMKSPNLYDPENAALTRYMDSALKAYALFKKDVDYVVKDGEVIIVDEFTGRLMFGRRYSEGLHQAIEAKEGVKIQRESLTYATITFQNYFRMYRKLAGMTGTALTEAEEFHKIYKLDVVVIPPNKPMVRQDSTDQIYKSDHGKFSAVAKEIAELHQQERPVLIGTVSIEKSELLSELLKRKGIPHNVLNAKNHLKEGEIIAEAGKPGAVTVATNMAGRGVDIILGGKQPEDGDERALREWQEGHHKVVELGGLHVIGTERHEARRIDNQLRGRSGRQGDPGSSRFFVSLEDDIVRRFGGDRIKGIMAWAGLDEETPIENNMISRMIADVQKRVEGYNFDIRKHLVEYDDVVNKQREIIYAERKKLLSGADLKANILEMIEKELKAVVAAHYDDRGIDRDDTGLYRELNAILPLPPGITAETLSQMHPQEIRTKVIELAHLSYEEREKQFGVMETRILERLVMLRVIDSLWVEHLTAMEDMRLGIGLEAVAQRDPLVAYKNKGHQLFGNLLQTIQHDVVHTIYHVAIKRENQPAAPTAMAKASGRTNANMKQPTATKNKPGRNDPCPCGSGKKYKHCCGK